MLPGSYYWLTFLFLLAGNSILVCQLAVTVEIGLISFLLLVIARQVSLGWLSFLPAAFTAILGAFLCPYNSHHWDSLLLVLVYCLVLLRCARVNEPPAFGTVFGAGVLGALSILCYQNQLAPVLLGASFFSFLLYLDHKSIKFSGRFLLQIASGMAAIFVPFLIYLALSGTFTDMFDCTVRFVLERYQGVNSVPYGHFSMQDIVLGTGSFPWIIFSSIPIGIIKWAPLIVLVASIIYFSKVQSVKVALRENRVLCIVVVLAFSLWLAELHRPDLKRLVLGEPLILVLMFYYVERLFQMSRVVYFVTGIACICIVLGLSQNAKLFLQYAPNQAQLYETRRGKIKTTFDMSLIEHLNKITNPGDKVLVYPYDTGLIYLMQITWPSRFPVLHYGYNTAEQFNAVIADMEKSNVKYVVWNRLLDNSNHNDFGFPSYVPVQKENMIMEPYLNKKYAFVGSYGNYCLLQRKLK